MLGCTDVGRALAFYDSVLAELGIVRTADLGERGATYGHRHGEGVHLGIGPPEDGRPATAGHGTVIGIRAPDEHAVDRTHARALALGAADENGLSRRRENGLYAAYFRDPDGNRVCVFTIIPEPA